MFRHTDFFNRGARLTHNGETYRFTEDDFEKLMKGNYWHHKTDPSSWLISATLGKARGKFRPALDREQIIQLCADTLNITPERIENSLDWTAQYMSWHDGIPLEIAHPWPRESKPKSDDKEAPDPS